MPLCFMIAVFPFHYSLCTVRLGESPTYLLSEAAPPPEPGFASPTGLSAEVVFLPRISSLL
jgi:hypothetical protein